MLLQHFSYHLHVFVLSLVVIIFFFLFQVLELREPQFNLSIVVGQNPWKIGAHKLRVVWKEWSIAHLFEIELAEANAQVNVTELFSGNMLIEQDGVLRESKFVSVEQPVTHVLNISDYDMAVLKNASYFDVYWFLNCKYIGKTKSLNFTMKYEGDDENFNMQELVVSSPDPVRIVIFCHFLFFF